MQLLFACPQRNTHWNTQHRQFPDQKAAINLHAFSFRYAENKQNTFTCGSCFRFLFSGFDPLIKNIFPMAHVTLYKMARKETQLFCLLMSFDCFRERWPQTNSMWKVMRNCKGNYCLCVQLQFEVRFAYGKVCKNAICMIIRLLPLVFSTA